MNQAAAEVHAGKRLYAAGWRQGSLLQAPGVAYVWNEWDVETGSLRVKERKVSPEERLVIVSQDCDISANPISEPCVEAFVCRVESAKFCEKIGKSARFFLIDSAARLVAHAARRAYLVKDALTYYQPEQWPSTSTRHNWFVRWLAHRYDRPAVPDDVVKAFQNPVDEVLRGISLSHPHIFRDFSEVVRELRVSDPPSSQPPYELALLLMANKDAITADQSDALEYVEKAIREHIDRDRVTLGEVALVTEARISAEEYFASRPLYLEYLTYQGDEVEGSEPLGRS
jgi:hypothetical protein